MECDGDVRTSVGGVVVGEMMRLVADVLLPENTQEAPLATDIVGNGYH